MINDSFDVEIQHKYDTLENRTSSLNTFCLTEYK